MGLLDSIFKNKSAKTTKVQRPSTDSVNAPAVKTTAQQAVLKPETKKNVSIKVTNRDVIEKNIRLESETSGLLLELYCVIRPARIFCHSVLVDKLGDLTKFIIISLYEGHSIEEITNLTEMGSATIKEETEYLMRGGLVNNDKQSLTELGLQYGRILKIFDELSEGIVMAFDNFANLFEPISENGYCSEVNSEHVLPRSFIPILSRNDNYANSLDIAIEQIEEDAPFSNEIKNSLYATVQIEKHQLGYKRMVIRDFGKGLIDKREEETCIKVAIPFEHVQYRPRYAWIDPYRGDISTIRDLNEKHDDILSEKGRLIISAFKEEEEAEVITVDADTVAGELNSREGVVERLPEDETLYILDRQKVMISLSSKTCEGIYLEEIGREELYKIRYFPYSWLEVR